MVGQTRTQPVNAGALYTLLMFTGRVEEKHRTTMLFFSKGCVQVPVHTTPCPQAVNTASVYRA